MLSKMNPVVKILFENATTFKERNDFAIAMEADVNKISNAMILNLYNSALEKSHVDFEGIPETKGDITKYSGFTSMNNVLTLVADIGRKQNFKIEEVAIVQRSIDNIIAYRDYFEKGFKLDKEFITMLYNILVYSCVEATSIIITSMVDFVKRPDKVEFTIVKIPYNGSWMAIDNLRKFNETVKNGDFSKTMDGIIKSGKNNLLGVDDVIVPAAIIGGAVILVPLIREAIFYFYYSRMKLSDYLNQQAMFLSLNKNNLELNSNIPIKKKNEIIKKQSDTIDFLHDIANKIKVDYTLTNKNTNKALEAENKKWTLDAVQNQTASFDFNRGFKIL